MTRAAAPHARALATAPPAGQPPAGGWRAHWPWVKRLLTFAFFAVVAYFVIRFAREIDWPQVWDNILATPWTVLAAAAALVAVSHGLYSCFDLLGRHYTGHGLPARQVMQVNFISYAFNLNFGSLVGGVAFRFRLYNKLGLSNLVITQVLTLSMLTNWLGYLVLGGAVFAFAPLQLPPGWRLSSDGLHWLGIGLALLAGVYLAACAAFPRREFHLRAHAIALPPPRMAALQLVMSCTNWAVMGLVIYVLMQGALPYSTVLSVLLVAAVAGVITHVPAGLGVLEGVFVALLAHQLPQEQILSALLTYRALYYIAPLAVGGLMFLRIELRGRSAPDVVHS